MIQQTEVQNAATDSTGSMTATEPEPSFAVLTLFTSEPEHRDQFATLAHDVLISEARWQRGLHSVELFTDESGQHIVTLARWKDRATFEAFKQSEDGRHVAELGLTLHPNVLFLHPEAIIKGERR